MKQLNRSFAMPSWRDIERFFVAMVGKNIRKKAIISIFEKRWKMGQSNERRFQEELDNLWQEILKRQLQVLEEFNDIK